MSGGIAADASVQSLLLELTIENQTYTFVFADEQRAITIGSASIADVVLRQHGVASLHFHIERENGSLWVMPAYGGADLQVNSTRVVGQHRLSAQSLIEFAGLQLHATVSSQSKSSRSVDCSVTRHAPTLAATVRIKSSGAPAPSSAPPPRCAEANPTFLPAASPQGGMPSSIDPHCTTVLDRPIFRQVKQHAWLSRVGAYSLRRPVLVWLVGTTIVFLTAGTTAWLTKRIAAEHGARSSQRQHQSSPPGGAEKRPSLVAPLPLKHGESSPVPLNTGTTSMGGEPPTQVTKPVEIVAFMGGSSTGDSAAPNAHVADAANQLILGRYADATTAYAALIASDRQEASLQAIVVLLQRKLSSRCATPTTAASSITCPEVIP